MSIRNLSIFAGGLAIAASSQVFAETDIVTTIAVSSMNIDTKLSDQLTISDDFVTNGKISHKRRSEIDTSGAEIGITVIEDSFYYGFTTLLTGQSASDYSSRYVQNHPDFGNRDLKVSNPENVSITSYSAYAGTRVGDNMRVYGGFTTGKTNAGEEYFIDESGPFIGAQYVYQIDGSTTVTLDLSYSNLSSDIDLKDSEDNDEELDESYVSSGNQDGYSVDADTTGYSFSVTWLRGLDRGRSYYFRFKAVDLDIEGGSVSITGPENATGRANVSGSKTMASLILGMGF